MDSQWGHQVSLISQMSLTALGLTHSPIQLVCGDPFPIGVKQPMCDGDHSPHSNAEVKSVSVPPLPLYAHVACMGAP